MFNGIAIRVFPTLLMPAFACSCAFALTAADSPSGHPSTGPAGSDLTLSSQEDFSPNYVSADLLVFTARYLESTHTSIEAAARILTAVRQDFLDWEDGEKAQKLIQWYVNLDPYDRAVYLSEVLRSRWSTDEYNRFWFAQADIFLRNESFPDVLRALRKIKEPLDPDSQKRLLSLQGLALLLLSRYSDAREALSNAQGFPRNNLIDHFNFAVSMIGEERKTEGAALLDELAEMPALSATDRAISDRANMALGWLWLKSRQGGTARPIFKRVSLTGPYSNMALLGLGWTELVPDGEVQTVKFQRSLRCADARNPPEGTYLLLFSSYRSCKSDRKASRFTYYRRFAFEADGATGEKRYRDALRPLLELSQREIQDPAVQEALLAVGYLYGQLGSSRAAIRAYQRAISLYESEIAALDGLLAKVANPETDLQDLTDNTDFMRETPALGSSRPYARITFDLESIRRSVEEHRATASWIERQIPSTERRRQLVSHVRTEWEIQNQAIAQTRSSLNSALREKTRTELVLKRERLIQYLAHARLAAARIYDEQRPPRS